MASVASSVTLHNSCLDISTCAFTQEAFGGTFKYNVNVNVAAGAYNNSTLLKWSADSHRLVAEQLLRSQSP